MPGGASVESLHEHLLAETQAIILLSPDRVNQEEVMIPGSFSVNPLLKVAV